MASFKPGDHKGFCERWSRYELLHLSPVSPRSTAKSFHLHSFTPHISQPVSSGCTLNLDLPLDLDLEPNFDDTWQLYNPHEGVYSPLKVFQLSGFIVQTNLKPPAFKLRWVWSDNGAQKGLRAFYGAETARRWGAENDCHFPMTDILKQHVWQLTFSLETDPELLCGASGCSLNRKQEVRTSPRGLALQKPQNPKLLFL